MFPELPPEEVTRALFEGIVVAWADRDLDSALVFVSDNVVHTLNVDGDLVPYARSVKGKPAMRAKLALLLDTFDFGAYVTDHLKVSGNVARASMRIVFIHKATRARLITRFRFVMEHHEGQISSIEEMHDASYIEAFARLVSVHAKS